MPSSRIAPTHIHLDVLGGMAGDMFIAAVLDARPDLLDGTVAAMRASGLPDEWTVAAEPASDGGLVGTRMRIEPAAPPAAGHYRYPDLVESVRNAALDQPVRTQALAILSLVAGAEAAVHGVPVDEVVLHEVGAIDSIADVAGAAYLIEALSPASWSVSPLPVGGGFVQTDHGRLPIPAPATQYLLEGFSFVDDGVSGERITPTGAAILRHLAPDTVIHSGTYSSAETGHGFGTRTLAGIPNLLRVRRYVLQVEAGPYGTEVAVIEFMVDDQSPEDLAVGLEALRDRSDVLEVLQIAAVGKKGRLGHSIQVLADPASLDPVTAACFEQTTTIGLRYRMEKRKVLNRREVAVTDEIGAKVADRPGGSTVKADMDDIARQASDHATREQLRREIERDGRAEVDDERD